MKGDKASYENNTAKNSSKFADLYNPGNVNVVYQDSITSSELNNFPDHSFTIIIIDECEDGECITDINSYALKSKQLFIHLPGKVYNWKLSPNTLGRRLIVSDIILETFSPTLKHTYSPLNRHEMISPDNEIYQKLSAEFSAIRKEINSEPVFPELIDARVRLLTLMINLWMEHIYGTSALVNTNNLAFRFHMLVDKYYKSQKNVAFYADELCITSNYLGVLCRKQYKKSPSAFIKERVLLEAKQMLHSSDKSIKEIAFELGFRNFSHFSYFFRTETGTTPKSYKQTMSKANVS
ncbi:helix-turn-helix domain-containing protein [Elizabethkingia sp. HX QKY]|uniref:helix-turn-helix domain-containing protein n=1 Tax=Elizabethkingia TaxID=308865 RepID=UPI002A244EF1|nr:helix-turn-helix domain-containing protein [Elizabethkingia sp. HX QKY]MDX8573530.1 helix-turn-helix domain-containing protein [Elizabethkingia sp. HX QKY]